ncbi:MAG: hypothetical protein WAV32_09255 [Halobacteriota archaeon]
MNTAYDKFQVVTSDRGAELALEIGEDKNYDSGGSGGRIKVLYETDFNYTGEFIARAKVDNGTGGAGGVCDGAGVNGRAGSSGEPGTRYEHAFPYTPPICHYDVGYLVSNVTSAEGHVGHDTNTSLVCYGTMAWYETVDEDTNIIMKVRTSINASMLGAMDWKDCPEVTNGQDISDLSSVSDGHRYIQWRAELVTYDLAKTPVLHSVNISYEYGIPFLVNSSGSIRYSSQYRNLPNFKLVYEHGAIIKNQTEGEIMLRRVVL